MLKFFSTGHLSRYVAAFFLLLILWAPAFLNPTNYISSAEPLFLLLSRLIGAYFYLPIIIAFLIVVFSALLVNQLATNLEFSSRYSSLGLFFFIIFSSALPVFFSFNPITIANIFILFLLRNIFLFPNSSSVIPLSFNSGLLIGAASLFYPPLIILLFFLWGAIFIHRIAVWRNFAASLVGIIMPYLFIFTWYLWENTVIENTSNLAKNYIYARSFELASFSLEYAIIVFVLIIVAFAAVNTLLHLREKNINLRRNLMIAVLYMAFILVLSWYYAKIKETMLLGAIPAALLLAATTTQSKKLKLLNIVIYLLLGLIVLNLYIGLGNSIFNNL